MTAARGDAGTGWRIDGWHVVPDHTGGERIYVRELIDWGSYEFEHCALSYGERLRIIESVGAAAILAIMAQIAEEKRRPYSIEGQGMADLDLLRRLSRPAT